MNVAAYILAAALGLGPGSYTIGDWQVEITPDVLLWVDPGGDTVDVPIYIATYQAAGCSPGARAMPRGDVELQLIGSDLAIIVRPVGATEIVYRSGSCLWSPPFVEMIFADGFESGDVSRWSFAAGSAQ